MLTRQQYWHLSSMQGVAFLRRFRGLKVGQDLPI